MPGLGKQYREKKEVDTSMAASGSDQRILIRGIGEAISVNVAGKSFQVTPGSFRFHGLLKRWRAEQQEKNQSLRKGANEKGLDYEGLYVSWRGKYDKIEALERNVKNINEKKSKIGEFEHDDWDSLEVDIYKLQLQIEEIKATITVEETNGAVIYMSIALAGSEQVVASTDEYGIRTVQFILLNSKDRYWRKNHPDQLTPDGFPTQELLDSVISYDELFDDANIQELNNVVDAFNQLNKPELFRKNALALAGVQ